MAQQVVLYFDGIEGRQGATHDVLPGLARIFVSHGPLQTDEHAHRQLVARGDGAYRVHRIVHAGLLHHEQRAGAAVGERGADRHPFILLADLDVAKVGVGRDRAQQPFAGHDVRDRDHDLDSACLEGGEDLRALQGVVHGDVIWSLTWPGTDSAFSAGHITGV